MGLLDMLHKKKTNNEQKDSFLTKLDNAKVYYDIDETEDGYDLLYTDAFDTEVFSIR